jgi:peroxiredoxin (alkyl hydroperoxide reductase subunit C)
MLEQTTAHRIGDVAPDFTAVTTHSAAMRFSEWQAGSWVVLFSHPADFTPVCTTELAEFARRSGDFEARGAKIIGLSVDSVHAHLAWIRNIRDVLGVDIPFPMIADIDMKVSQAYGMIHAGASSTATVRAVFVIDPKRIIRAIIYYPMTAGRNVEEVLRIVTALQTADDGVCATPVNWRAGERVLALAPKSVGDVEERLSRKDYEVKDFYLCLREAPEA